MLGITELFLKIVRCLFHLAEKMPIYLKIFRLCEETRYNVTSILRVGSSLYTKLILSLGCSDIYQANLQTMQVKLSDLPRCNGMVADSHLPRFFGTVIQCETAHRFSRSVVKVGLNLNAKISIFWVEFKMKSLVLSIFCNVKCLKFSCINLWWLSTFTYFTFFLNSYYYESWCFAIS